MKLICLFFLCCSVTTAGLSPARPASAQTFCYLYRSFGAWRAGFALPLRDAGDGARWTYGLTQSMAVLIWFILVHVEYPGFLNMSLVLFGVDFMLCPPLTPMGYSVEDRSDSPSWKRDSPPCANTRSTSLL